MRYEDVYPSPAPAQGGMQARPNGSGPSLTAAADITGRVAASAGDTGAAFSWVTFIGLLVALRILSEIAD